MLCEGNFGKLRFLLLPLASARVTRRAISSPRIDAVLPTLCGDESTCMYGAASIYLEQRCCCWGCRAAAGGSDDAVELQSPELGRPPSRSAAQSKSRTHRAAKAITTRHCRRLRNSRMVKAASMLLLTQVDVWTARKAHVLPLSASESRFTCFQEHGDWRINLRVGVCQTPT
jgi:hypothetical protein